MSNPREKVLSILEQQLYTLLDKNQIKDLEKGIYNWSIKYADKNEIIKNWNNDRFINLYNAKTISVLSNLNPKSYIHNDKLITKIVNKNYCAHDIPFLKPEEMYPELWHETINNKIQRDQRMIQNDKPAAKTNAFKCGKCKKNECTFEEKQIKSCDEPMTLFITCINCKNKWRI